MQKEVLDMLEIVKNRKKIKRKNTEIAVKIKSIIENPIAHNKITMKKRQLQTFPTPLTGTMTNKPTIGAKKMNKIKRI